MKVRGLDGKTYTWSLGQYVGKPNTNHSDLHEKVREFLEENFPALQILEEVFLPGTNLYLDFYLPIKKIAIEAQGDQHYKDNRHFFANKLEFYRAQARDNKKTQFCEINGIKLIYFHPYEDCNQWKIKLGIMNQSQKN